MEDPFAPMRRKLEDSVLQGRGESEPALRKKAFDNRELPADLAAYVDKVHRHAYKTTDEEVEALRARYSDDQLFEITLSSALGAAAEALDAGLGAVEAAAARPEERPARVG